MLLPAIGATLGLHAVNLAVAGVILIGLGLIALVYRAPDASVAVEGERGSMTGVTICAVIAAGLIWCLYNIGFAMIFSFGPSMLVEHGWSSAAAGSIISIVLWLAALSVPMGGFLADRTKRGETILVTGCIAFALLMLLLSRSGMVLPIIVALGILCGLPAGAILSLPAIVLDQKIRPIGMGLFYTVYYAGMLAGPAIGGKLSTSFGSASAALDFGAVVLLACPGVLWLFRQIVAGRHLSAVVPISDGKRS
jgi:predicted MFS family arabinose efflux permease